jgi:hypothetical protein
MICLVRSIMSELFLEDRISHSERDRVAKKNYYQRDGSLLKFQNRGTNNWKILLHNYSTLTYRKANQFRQRKQ